MSVPEDLQELYDSTAEWDGSLMVRFAQTHSIEMPWKGSADVAVRRYLIERIAALEAELEIRNSYIANYEHATKLERGDWEAQNKQLREALEKIRDRDGACECDDHSSPECCANIEWNDGSCCPHCVAGAALAATEPKQYASREKP